MNLANVFAPLAVKVACGVALAALTGACVQTARIEGFLFVKGYKAEVADLNNRINDMRVAKAVALEKAKTRRGQDEATTHVIATEIDYGHQTLSAAGRAAVATYAAAHSVRGQGGVSSCRPVATPVPVPAPEHDGPGEAAEMVAVPRQDLDDLVEAALRAASNHQLATALIEAGRALPTETSIPEVSFGPAPAAAEQ